MALLETVFTFRICCQGLIPEWVVVLSPNGEYFVRTLDLERRMGGPKDA